MAESLIKRLFDFIISLIGLIALSPIFLLIGCIIKLNDKGPVFFRQKRVGKGGKLFILYKFRTMKISESPENEQFEPGNNSRITSVGRFLRRTKLDELPQMINVLKGEMSFVGPRPEVEEWIKAYPEKWAQVLTVKPGITCMASIEFRDEEKILSESSDPRETYLRVILPRKLDMCIEYVNNHTFFGDIRIILLTLKTIFLR